MNFAPKEYAAAVLRNNGNKWMSCKQIISHGTTLNYTMKTSSKMAKDTIIYGSIGSRNSFFEKKKVKSRAFFRLTPSGLGNIVYEGGRVKGERRKSNHTVLQHPFYKKKIHRLKFDEHSDEEADDEEQKTNITLMTFIIRAIHSRDNVWMDSTQIYERGCLLNLDKNLKKPTTPRNILNTVRNSVNFERDDKKFRLSTLGYGEALRCKFQEELDKANEKGDSFPMQCLTVQDYLIKVLNSKNNEAMTASEIFDVGVEKDWYKETNPWVTSVQRVIDCLRRSNKFEMDDGKYRMSFIGVERAKEVCEDFDATKLISTGRAKRKRSFKYDDMDLSDEEIRPLRKKRRTTKKTVTNEGELLKKKRKITHVAIKKESIPTSTETYYDLTVDSEDESVGEVLPDADSKPDQIVIQEEDHTGQESEDLPPPISPALDSEMNLDAAADDQDDIFGGPDVFDEIFQNHESMFEDTDSTSKNAGEDDRELITNKNLSPLTSTSSEPQNNSSEQDVPTSEEQSSLESQNENSSQVQRQLLEMRQFMDMQNKMIQQEMERMRKQFEEEVQQRKEMEENERQRLIREAEERERLLQEKEKLHLALEVKMERLKQENWELVKKMREQTFNFKPKETISLIDDEEEPKSQVESPIPVIDLDAPDV